MKVLLIYPPYAWEYKRPALGLAYIASVLIESGIEVDILDMDAEYLTLKDISSRVDKDYSLFGISFLTPQFNIVMELVRLIRKECKETLIVVGGPHVSAMPEESIDELNTDFAVLGEGEYTIVNLIKNLNNKKYLEKLPGLVLRNGVGNIINQGKGETSDINSLPFPAWHLFPLESNCYNVSLPGVSNKEMVFPLLTSRACPYDCIFCDSHTVFGRGFRSRTPENVVEEIKYLNERFKARQFEIVDDTFTVDAKRVHEVCALILKNNLKIKWICNARVNLVDLELLKAMKKAGCTAVNYGVESGDPVVIQNISKKIKIEQIINAHKLAKEAGLIVTTFIMVGSIGETLDSVRLTGRLIEMIDSDYPGLSISTPFPGSPLYKIALENEWLQVRDWSKYVTAPYVLDDYLPVMRTDVMTGEEILKAYYYLMGKISKKKLKTKYGQYYYMNPSMYINELKRARNIRGVLRKFALVKNLISNS